MPGVTDDPLAEQLETLKELRAMRSPEAGPALDDFLTQLLRGYLYTKTRNARLTERLDRLEKVLTDGGVVTSAQLRPAESFAPSEGPTRPDR